MLSCIMAVKLDSFAWISAPEFLIILPKTRMDRATTGTVIKVISASCQSSRNIITREPMRIAPSVTTSMILSASAFCTVATSFVR